MPKPAKPDKNPLAAFETGQFSFELPDLDLDFNFGPAEATRIIAPPKAKWVAEKHVRFKNALEFAAQFALKRGMKYHAIVSGNFIFGDFIEAIFHQNPAMTARRMVISTLAYNTANVDSLKNLMSTGAVKKLDLITSSYFYSTDKGGAIRYTYQELDTDENRFQLIIAGNHTKIVLFETENGSKVVMHGSANLRSAQCAEQISIEESPALYDFYLEFLETVIQEFKTINHNIPKQKPKPLRYKKLNDLI